MKTLQSIYRPTMITLTLVAISVLFGSLATLGQTSRSRVSKPASIEPEIKYDKFKDLTKITATFTITLENRVIRVSVVGEHSGQNRNSPDSLDLTVGSTRINDAADDGAVLILLLDGQRLQVKPVDRSRSGDMLMTIIPITVDQVVKISKASSAEAQLGSLELKFTEVHRALFGKVASYFRNGEAGGHLEVPEFETEYVPNIAYTAVKASFGIRNENGQVLFIRLTGQHDGRLFKGSYSIELNAISASGLLTNETLSVIVDGNVVKFGSVGGASGQGSILMKPTLQSLASIALGKEIIWKGNNEQFAQTRAQRSVIAKFVAYFAPASQK